MNIPPIAWLTLFFFVGWALVILANRVGAHSETMALDVKRVISREIMDGRNTMTLVELRNLLERDVKGFK